MLIEPALSTLTKWRPPKEENLVVREIQSRIATCIHTSSSSLQPTWRPEIKQVHCLASPWALILYLNLPLVFHLILHLQLVVIMATSIRFIRLIRGCVRTKCAGRQLPRLNTINRVESRRIGVGFLEIAGWWFFRGWWDALGPGCIVGYCGRRV